MADKSDLTHLGIKYRIPNPSTQSGLLSRGCQLQELDEYNLPTEGGNAESEGKSVCMKPITMLPDELLSFRIHTMKHARTPTPLLLFPRRIV